MIAGCGNRQPASTKLIGPLKADQRLIGAKGAGVISLFSCLMR